MRIDKFLKVSRLIKRRTVANEVADAGRIVVNGREVKASYQVKIGDEIEIMFCTKPVKLKVLSVVIIFSSRAPQTSMGLNMEPGSKVLEILKLFQVLLSISACFWLSKDSNSSRGKLIGMVGSLGSEVFDEAEASISPVLGSITSMDAVSQGNSSMASLTPSSAIFCIFMSMVDVTEQPFSGA